MITQQDHMITYKGHMITYRITESDLCLCLGAGEAMQWFLYSQLAQSFLHTCHITGLQTCHTTRHNGGNHATQRDNEGVIVSHTMRQGVIHVTQ